MAYDLAFVPRRPDESWEEALEAAEEAAEDADDEEGLDAESLAAWERIVLQVRELLGEVETSESGDFCQASHEGTGITLILHPHEAAISVPYWHSGEQAARVIDLIYSIGTIVERETGLSGYDPQIDEGISDADDVRRREAVDIFNATAAMFVN